MLTQEYLKTRLRYEPETGHFYWVKSKATWRNGSKAGCYNSGGGYVLITLDGDKYLGHRLAWFYLHGVWPTEIDHANRIRNDNRIANLRLCSRSENLMNQPDRKRKFNLPRGVYKANNKYQARIHCQGEFIYLGLFKTPKLADEAYKKKRIELFGEFAIGL